MTAATFAAVTSLEVVLFGENDVAFFAGVKVFWFKRTSLSEPGHVFCHAANYTELTKVGRKSYLTEVVVPSRGDWGSSRAVHSNLTWMMRQAA